MYRVKIIYGRTYSDLEKDTNRWLSQTEQLPNNIQIIQIVNVAQDEGFTLTILYLEL